VKEEPRLTDADRLRRALMLAGQTQILVQPCELTPDYVLFLWARGCLKEKPIWMGLARGEMDSRSRVVRAVDRLALGDQVTPAFAMIREGIHEVEARTFLDQANIIHHRVWVEEGAQGELVLHRGIDLAVNSTAALGKNRFRARVVRGVADTLAEHLVLGPGASVGENTIGVFEAASRGGQAPVVLRRADPALLEKLELPPDASARIRADLADGNVVVLARAAAGAWSWWRVQPLTGETVGVMATGFNSGMTEKKLTDAQVAERVAQITSRMKPGELAKMKDYADFMKLAKGNWQVAKGLEQAAMRMAITLGRFAGGLAG
jgi:hypothetical protein